MDTTRKGGNLKNAHKPEGGGGHKNLSCKDRVCNGYLFITFALSYQHNQPIKMYSGPLK